MTPHVHIPQPVVAGCSGTGVAHMHRSRRIALHNMLLLFLCTSASRSADCGMLVTSPDVRMGLLAALVAFHLLLSRFESQHFLPLAVDWAVLCY